MASFPTRLAVVPTIVQTGGRHSVVRSGLNGASMMSQLKVSSRHDITRAQQQAETAGRRIMANYPKTQSWIRGQLTTPIQDLLKSHGAFEIEATATIGQVHTKAHIEQWGAAQLVIHFDLDSTKPVVKRWRFLAPEHASQARSIEKSEDAIEIVTTNGDALFVPAGWTHQVVSECELAAVAFVVGALLGNLRCEKTLLHYALHGPTASLRRNSALDVAQLVNDGTGFAWLREQGELSTSSIEKLRRQLSARVPVGNRPRNRDASGKLIRRKVCC